MSRCHGSVPQDVRPRTARVVVTELSGSGHINPSPATKPRHDSETAVEPFLTLEKLVCSLQKCLKIWSGTQISFEISVHLFTLVPDVFM